MVSATTLDVQNPWEPQKKRRDEQFHSVIRKITESQLFNAFIMGIILVNSIMIALETDHELVERTGVVFDILDYIFLAVYTLEFILKIYAEPLLYWHSYYNIFDFIVLGISWVQTGIELTQSGGQQNLKALQVLRALRALRALRTVSFIRGLQVLVTALLDTIRRWVINIMILLFVFMFLFAIMGFYFWGPNSKNPNADLENWGTLGAAMMSLVSFVTVDGWTELQNKLDQISLASRIFTITFIFLGHFVLSNIFVGVIIINISEATEKFKIERIQAKEAVVKAKKEFMMMRQHQEVQQMLERQKRGSFSNFSEMVLDFEKCLNHEDCELTSDLYAHLLWLETFTKTLDHMDNILLRTQQLHFEIANLLVRVAESNLEKKFRT